ncbi:hypothetical protein P7C73_g4270, partial [Tremellales sp. Uapishka_1]
MTCPSPHVNHATGLVAPARPPPSPPAPPARTATSSLPAGAKLLTGYYGRAGKDAPAAPRAGPGHRPYSGRYPAEGASRGRDRAQGAAEVDGQGERERIERVTFALASKSERFNRPAPNEGRRSKRVDLDLVQPPASVHADLEPVVVFPAIACGRGRVATTGVSLVSDIAAATHRSEESLAAPETKLQEQGERRAVCYPERRREPKGRRRRDGRARAQAQRAVARD